MPVTKHQRPTLLFDLGNVINEFVGFKEIKKHWMPNATTDQVRSKWLHSPSMKALERGFITPLNFAEKFVEEWDIPLAPADYLDVFISWAKPPFTGSQELLKQLSLKHNMACLSNTNEAHWQRIIDEFDIVKYFNHHFLSHKMGMVKPDTEIYAAVLATLEQPASDIIFFDDTPENVDTARGLGIESYKVEGIEQLKLKCNELGLT